MPNGELRLVLSDGIATLMVRIVDFITPDGKTIAKEAVVVRSGKPSEVVPVYNLARDTKQVRLYNGDEYAIIGASYATI